MEYIIILIIATALILSASITIYKGGYQKGYEASETDHSYREEMAQEISSNIIRVSHTPETSIITEKKDCDSKGGEFSILSNEIRVDAGVYTDAVAFKKASHNVYTLTCTSPAEEIFNIQVK